MLAAAAMMAVMQAPQALAQDGTQSVGPVVTVNAIGGDVRVAGGR